MKLGQHQQETTIKDLSLGISPGVEDTMMFFGIVHQKIGGFPCFAPPCVEDIFLLDEWGREQRLDVTRLSVAGLAEAIEHYWVLPSGLRAWNKRGPFLIALDRENLHPSAACRVVTSTRCALSSLLIKIYQPESRLEILPDPQKVLERVIAGKGDVGLVMNSLELQQTSAQMLFNVDLSTWWREQYKVPLYPYCVAVKRDLGVTNSELIDKMIKASIDYSVVNWQNCRGYVDSTLIEADRQGLKNRLQSIADSFVVDSPEDRRGSFALLYSIASKQGLFPQTTKRLFLEKEML